ncbi:MAG TPA: hypothetical protein VFZ21_11005, partial [Gemmatimonadaceae bacterium]|nr:hypothetical protein [Gemmatimonadaceae bacterium]
PFIGLIVYPETWAVPLGVAAAVLVLAALLRLSRRDDWWLRSSALGVLATVLAVLVAATAVRFAGDAIGRAHETMGWGGAPAFRGVYSAAVVILALAVSIAGYAAARRWASAAGLHAGALVTWSIITVLVSVRFPGVSFLFTWPLLAAAIALHVAIPPSRSPGEQRAPLAAEGSVWGATIIAAAVVVPVIYAVSAVLLGAIGPGGIAGAVFTALLAWLLAPQLEALAAGHAWHTAGLTLLAALALFGVGATTVRSSPDHPTPSTVVYAMDADGADAWLVTRGTRPPATVRADTTAPAWVKNIRTAGGLPAYARLSRASVEPPSAVVVADSAADGARELTLRIRAAAGTGTVAMRASGPRVLRASVDGRAVDTTRYRSPVRQWRLDYAAPPDTGFTLGLTLESSGPLTLDLVTYTPGLPLVPGLEPPRRAPHVVTVQSGDMTVVRRTLRFD